MTASGTKARRSLPRSEPHWASRGPCSAGPQRGPLIPCPDRPHRGVAPRQLHAHGRSALSRVQSHLSPAARGLDHAGPRGLHRRDSGQRPAHGHPADCRNRQRAHPWPRRSGRGRDAYSRWQARPVHRGGRHPADTHLAVSLDVGTDNQALLEDDLYLGWRQPAPAGRALRRACRRVRRSCEASLPAPLVQWEDFKTGNALGLQERYRKVTSPLGSPRRWCGRRETRGGRARYSDERIPAAGRAEMWSRGARCRRWTKPRVAAAQLPRANERE